MSRDKIVVELGPDSKRLLRELIDAVRASNTEPQEVTPDGVERQRLSEHHPAQNPATGSYSVGGSIHGWPPPRDSEPGAFYNVVTPSRRPNFKDSVAGRGIGQQVDEAIFEEFLRRIAPDKHLQDVIGITQRRRRRR